MNSFIHSSAYMFRSSVV